jgi:hypothetical protein
MRTRTFFIDLSKEFGTVVDASVVENDDTARARIGSHSWYLGARRLS